MTSIATSVRVSRSNLCRAPVRVQCCKAPQRDSASRRDIVLGTAVAFSSLLLVADRPALALIPDDEDEDLINKAKANRQTRLQEQRGTTREFIKSEGLTDVKLQSQLPAVQRAVVKLAESGAQLEKGDLQGVSSTLGESWVTDFNTAAKVAGGADALVAVSSGLSDLRAAASRNDAAASKRTFVALVAAFKSWTTSAGIQGQLQGL